MKLLIDENVRNSIVEFLENKKEFKVTSINNLQKGLPDDEVYNYAIKNKMVIITHDKDFKKYKNLNNYGIIFSTAKFSFKIELYKIKIIEALNYIKNHSSNCFDFKDIFISISSNEMIVTYKRYNKKGKFKDNKTKKIKKS